MQMSVALFPIHSEKQYQTNMRTTNVQSLMNKMRNSVRRVGRLSLRRTNQNAKRFGKMKSAVEKLEKKRGKKESKEKQLFRPAFLQSRNSAKRWTLPSQKKESSELRPRENL